MGSADLGKAALVFAKSISSNPQVVALTVNTAHAAFKDTKIVGALTGAATIAANSHASLSALSDTIQATTGVNVREHVTKHAKGIFEVVGDKAKEYSAKLGTAIDTHVAASKAVDGAEKGIGAKGLDAIKDLGAKIKGHIDTSGGPVKALAELAGKGTSRA